MGAIAKETTLLDEFAKDHFYKAVRESQVSRAVRSSDQFSIGTAIGSIRKENQDAAVIIRARFPSGSNRDFDLSVVCDGMGGMRGGQQASAYGLTQFAFALLEQPIRPVKRWLLNAIDHANLAVYRRFKGDGGTTLSAVMTLYDNTSYIIHAGDSRVYSIVENELPAQLSTDDTLSALLKRDRDSEHGSQLVQFVGMGDSLEPHIIGELGGIPRFFITSDGIHNVADSTLRRLIRSAATNQDLVRRALTLSEILGGVDNATAIAFNNKFSGGAFSGSEGGSVELQTAMSHHYFYSNNSAIRSSKNQKVKSNEGVGMSAAVKPDLQRKKRKKTATVDETGESPIQLDLSPVREISVEFPGESGENK